MDRRQNNGSVKAVSPRHCPATAQLLFQLLCLGRVTKTMSVALPWRNNSNERSLTFAAQLHLPAHDLFWANVRVQLHHPPLDLAWNPGFPANRARFYHQVSGLLGKNRLWSLQPARRRLGTEQWRPGPRLQQLAV